MSDAAQQYIDNLFRTRGQVRDYYKVMARADFEVLSASNQVIEATYTKTRTLDARTKELLFILSLTVMRAGKAHIQNHIRFALNLGVSSMEILEAIELALLEAGVVVFEEGFDAWREVVGADGLEPSSGVVAKPAR